MGEDNDYPAVCKDVRVERKTVRSSKTCYIRKFFGAFVPLALVFIGFPRRPVAPRPQTASNLDIRLMTDEADAVLSVLQELKAGTPLDKTDWDRLFATEGYIRLKKREFGVKRPFEDAEFRDFVLSSELLAKTEALAETLVRWERADLKAAAHRALAYLPAGTTIRAKVYPVIKPKTNSFVFELKTDPAIFLYLNPEMTAAQFENTVAHELHHIGYASACLPAYETDLFKRRPEEVRTVIEWAGAFGEGMAMLAAAGGPDIHPHAVSPQTDRDRWDKDMANFNADVKKVEAFFLDVLDGRLKGEEAIGQVASSFFGIQGPWYTVGWKMAAVIEKTFGRAKLIDCLCDPVAFLAAYNEAAAKHNAITGESLAIWSPLLLKRLQDRH
jgi:hypothetical protein